MQRRPEQAVNGDPETEQRDQLRRSPWDLLLIPLGLGSWLLVWYALFRLVWAFHVALYPAHEFRDFWGAGISAKSFVLSFLMLFALMPGSVGVGLMLGNLRAWLIPCVRRALEAEARELLILEYALKGEKSLREDNPHLALQAFKAALRAAPADINDRIFNQYIFPLPMAMNAFGYRVESADLMRSFAERPGLGVRFEVLGEGRPEIPLEFSEQAGQRIEAPVKFHDPRFGAKHRAVRLQVQHEPRSRQGHRHPPQRRLHPRPQRYGKFQMRSYQ